VNWVQAKALAEVVGGHLVTLHSKQENEFVFNLIKDKKFWFKWDSSHNYVMNGPLMGDKNRNKNREDNQSLTTASLQG
jgi:hypothetical protein